MPHFKPIATVFIALAGCSQPAPPTLRSLYGVHPPRELRASKTALLLIDTQREFLDGKLALPDVEHAALDGRVLLDWARRTGVLVVHVRHVPASAKSPLFTPGTPQAEPLDGFQPRDGEWVVTKPTGGAFSAPSLDTRLHERGIDHLVLAGFMTHLAVASTAADATARGFGVLVASDATATRALPATDGRGPISAAEVQRASLAALADRFADVMSTADVIALSVVP